MEVNVGPEMIPTTRHFETESSEDFSDKAAILEVEYRKRIDVKMKGDYFLAAAIASAVGGTTTGAEARLEAALGVREAGVLFDTGRVEDAGREAAVFLS
jgi:hypothetical protein